MSMTETIKLYDRDAYAIEFEADIISVSYTHLDVYKRQALDFSSMQR